MIPTFHIYLKISISYDLRLETNWCFLKGFAIFYFILN